ncbi:MAG TPA: thermonuclease family protein [Xanthobacteraceae bacterium]|nr:thermonuclease family protein [Xanthobacteraceae bacterium]
MIAASVAALFAGVADAQPRKPAVACVPGDTFVARVKTVFDGRTLALADGREVLLASIETPGTWARDALPALVAGRDLSFSQIAPQPDRYGRLLARAFRDEDGTPLALEAEMVGKGLAVAGMPPANDKSGRNCLETLLAAENTARKAKLGLWSDPDYDTKASDNPTAILAARGRFTIIEGKVLSVGESGGTVYINFGRRWSEDFTVTILKRLSARFTAAGMDPKRLEGRKVRVRGFVEERGGPWIEATGPEQIEIAEGP